MTDVTIVGARKMKQVRDERPSSYNLRKTISEPQTRECLPAPMPCRQGTDELTTDVVWRCSELKTCFERILNSYS